jgi:hypothetical protein
VGLTINELQRRFAVFCLLDTAFVYSGPKTVQIYGTTLRQSVVKMPKVIEIASLFETHVDIAFPLHRRNRREI